MSSSRSFASVLSGVVLILALVGSAYCDSLEPSLHATIDDDDVKAGCSDDPLGYRAMRFVSIVFAALKINAGKVAMIGCTQLLSFRTAPASDDEDAYKIYYPVSKTADIESYYAPLIHEFAHIYQIRQAGDLGTLRQKTCIERIELGADFLAGYLFKLATGKTNPMDFAANLNLLGDYQQDSPDHHGRPPDRGSAFRLGFFKHQTESSVDRAYREFQSEDFVTATSGADFIKGRCNL